MARTSHYVTSPPGVVVAAASPGPRLEPPTRAPCSLRRSSSSRNLQSDRCPGAAGYTHISGHSLRPRAGVAFGKLSCGRLEEARRESSLAAAAAAAAAAAVRRLSTFGLAVRSGSETTKRGGALHPAADRASHVHYDFFGLDYDIGLIKVDSAFKLGRLARPLPLARTEPQTGAVAVQTGWGSGAGQPRLLSDSLLVDTLQVANSVDPGGPLVANGRLIGVVSWATGCVSAGHPGVYADVSEMADWVLEYVRNYDSA
ncbi:trypsin alpha-3-like [Schistocerca serialis cubense]|uniref:trypsin alpha-3-like n=1 Tax=Schistocerca serialis cubense TaxID=2023355 RepID=UPI00214EB0FA|nr:trypsin alpha-3-like [Schistocerca serialis cubense]